MTAFEACKTHSDLFQARTLVILEFQQRRVKVSVFVVPYHGKRDSPITVNYQTILITVNSQAVNPIP